MTLNTKGKSLWNRPEYIVQNLVLQHRMTINLDY